jgi:hypothetical protein
LASFGLSGSAKTTLLSGTCMADSSKVAIIIFTGEIKLDAFCSRGSIEIWRNIGNGPFVFCLYFEAVIDFLLHTKHLPDKAPTGLLPLAQYRTACTAR